MKPIEAEMNLRHISSLLMAGQPLPPELRAWLVGAIRQRLISPGSSLDRLLGLQSRAGGRLHALSPLPARDQAIRELAGSEGTVVARAQALCTRLHQHQAQTDPDLAEIERAAGLWRARLHMPRCLRREVVARRKALHRQQRPLVPWRTSPTTPIRLMIC